MKDIKHTWNVQLRASNYTQNQGAAVARVIHPRSYTLDDILAAVAGEDSTALTPENLRYAVKLFLNKVETCLLEGANVNLPIGRLTPAVEGTWQSSDRQVPAVRALNRPTVNYALSPRLRKRMDERVLMDVHSFATSNLHIFSVEDKRSGTTNERLTPGGVIILKGKLLRMDGDLPQRGLYLTRTDDNGDQRTWHLTPDTFFICTKGRIAVQLPDDLPAGRYRLRIVSQCTTGPRPRKTAAEYVMPGEMEVSGA